MKIRNVLSSLLLGAVISMPVYVHADSNDEQILKLMSEFADKPEQHQALAKYYKEESESAKKKLETHRKMSKNYIGYSKIPSAPNSMKTHCEELIKAYEAAIKEYNALAAEHEASAKK